MKYLAMLQNPQFLAAARHALTALMAILATLGFISASQSADVVGALVTIGTAIGQIGAACTVIVGIIGPVYATLSASDKNQIKSVEAIANDPTSTKSDAAKTALVNAASTIAADPVAPQSFAAKAAILNAAASIPEVDKIVAPAISVSIPSDKVTNS